MASSSDTQLHESRKTFWNGMAPSMEAMLQTENAEVLAEVDTAEILRYLPDHRGKRVLDLGAGIGRFTRELATVADHVTAVDISERFIEQNKDNNKNRSNVSYICEDVTKLTFPSGSFDLIFSSWILKYLNDEEIIQFLSQMLTWLTSGGHFFFRETCFHDIATINRKGNPTIFRTLLQYLELVCSVSIDGIHFKLLSAKNMQSYIQFQGAPNQICFLSERVIVDTQEKRLNGDLESRYSLQTITWLEQLHGSPWVYIGQESTAKTLYGRLKLRPGQRVLDIGCGTGTSAFFIVQQYRAHVHGIDLSTNGIYLAIERQLKLNMDLRRMVQFEIGDVLKKDFDEGYFDVIYSRECINDIPDKPLLFSKIYHWLRPGGVLLFTDCMIGSLPSSGPLLDYLETIRPSIILPLDSYKQELQSTGFKNVMSYDLGEKWLEILQKDLNIFTSIGNRFANAFFYDHMCDISKKRIEWINDNQITWGMIIAIK